MRIGRGAGLADALRLEVVENFGNVAALAAQPSGQGGLSHHPDPERGAAHFERLVIERLIEQTAAVRRRAEVAPTQANQDRAADVGRTALESAVQGRDAGCGFQPQQGVERRFADFFIAVVEPFIEPTRDQRRRLPSLRQLLDRVEPQVGMTAAQCRLQRGERVVGFDLLQRGQRRLTHAGVIVIQRLR